MAWRVYPYNGVSLDGKRIIFFMTLTAYCYGVRPHIDGEGDFYQISRPDAAQYDITAIPTEVPSCIVYRNAHLPIGHPTRKAHGDIGCRALNNELHSTLIGQIAMNVCMKRSAVEK